MPFTPFHFGAHTCVGLPLNKKINILVFLLANVIIDIEPLVVIIFNFTYPLHGYAHTFLGAAILGGIWGFFSYKFNNVFEKLLQILRLRSKVNFKQYIISGIAGALLHVLFDAPLYVDIKPFYPLNTNPFYGLISNPWMYKFCTFLVLPAIILYICTSMKYKNEKIG